MATTQNTFKISQLCNISELDPHDLFLVSDHRDNKFYTRKLSAATLFEKIESRIISHINSEEFITRLASMLSTAMTPAVTLSVIANATPTVINQAVPQVSTEVIPIVIPEISNDVTPIVTENAIPLVSSAALPIISSEAIPVISDELTTLTIQNVISSNEISNAIIDNSTAIGYGVYSAVSSQIDSVITDELITDLLENEALSTAVTSIVSSDAENIWDILTDGKADSGAIINAGDADPTDDIVNAGGA